TWLRLLCHGEFLALQRTPVDLPGPLVGRVQPAEHAAPSVQPLLGRERDRAHAQRVRAPRVKTTSAWRRDQVRRCPGDGMELGRIQRDRRAEEVPRTWVCGLAEGGGGGAR